MKEGAGNEVSLPPPPSLSLGALCGELGGRVSLMGTLQRIILSQGLREKGEIFLSGELLVGNPRDTQNKALKMGNVRPRGPSGESGGVSFTGGLLRDR
jgi:hypothetical protein